MSSSPEPLRACPKTWSWYPMGMERTPYPTDLTDRQWRLIEPSVPRPKSGGRPAQYTRRETVDAILYQTRNGCVWRALPHNLPPYRIVFHYFRLWKKEGV